MTQAAQLAQYGANNVGLSFKNRIINGDMTIDQRNAGASVTLPNGAAAYSFVTDRWGCSRADGATATGQQSSTAPVGFNNSLVITNGTGITVASSGEGVIIQCIEGFNTADLGWGTANAQSVTLSFWVRSSITGTHSGSLANSAFNRCYPFSYTINAANTWEYKTITVPGDTTGTWLTNNGRGICLVFNNGSGSNFLGTANAWTATQRYGVSGSVALNSVTGSTWFVTGVQLEKGTVATSFDYLPYGTELMLCQRYYERVFINNSMPIAIAHCFNSTNNYGVYPFKVEKRAAPTGISSGTFLALTAAGGSGGGSLNFDSMTTSAARIGIIGASGLVAGNASSVWGDSSPMMAFNSEL